MPDGMKTTMKKDGRMRGPNLSDPQLTAIGNAMVAEQKDRWSKGIDANGQPAKPLGKRYAIIKQAVLHKRPIRDNFITGLLVKNFTLRKAAEGRIRAENTTRLAREHATRANSYDQMIGFSMLDVAVVAAESQKAYQAYLNKAWIPLDTGGRNRRPSTLNSL